MNQTDAQALGGRDVPARPLDPRFVPFMNSFARDLQEMKAILDALVAPAEHSAAVAETAARVYRPFEGWLDARLAKMTEIFGSLPMSVREHHADVFRTSMAPLTGESEFLLRTNERPRGYAGDSETMRMLYEPDFRGRSVFGALLHHHPTQTAAAAAVRYRVGLIGDLVARYRSPAATTRVLSLACGPARELRHLVRSPDDAQGLELVLADQDQAALSEAAEEIAHVERSSGTPLHTQLAALSVLDVLRGKAQSLGRFDCIYTLGLFDYLPRTVATRLVERLFAMTNDGGTLLVGNFHVDCPTRTYLDVWMRWPLLYRTEDELLALADTVPAARRTVSRDPTGSQMFLYVER